MIQWFNKKMSKKRKGFTLVELVVVIAILGILAAIAIPRFATTLDGSRTKADDATARVIESAVQLYQANSDGNALPDAAAFKSEGAMKDYLAEDYITTTGVKKPQDTANEFFYNTKTGAVKSTAEAPSDDWVKISGQE